MLTRTRFALFAAGLLGMIGAVEANCCDAPLITLDTPTVDGATIKCKGTFTKGTKKFQSITVFAMNKDKGRIYSAAITTAPTGSDWPNSGTLNVVTTEKGTYQVWAVLHLTDDTKTDYYHGSAVREVTVNQGDNPSGPYIQWGENQPTAANGAISGSGTYTIPQGATNNGVLFLVWKVGGGPMIGPDQVVDANMGAWGRTSIAGLTMGQDYYVSGTIGFTSGGNPYQYGCPIVIRTP